MKLVAESDWNLFPGRSAELERGGQRRGGRMDQAAGVMFVVDSEVKPGGSSSALCQFGYRHR